MDAYEATKIVFSRIQNLDPENASKIIGRLLIQDHGDKEMIRLAFGPESLVHSVILKVRKELGLSSSTPSPPLTPSSPLPFLSNNNPISLSRQNSSCSLLSSRLPSPLSIPSSWGASCFSDFKNTEDLIGTPNSSTSFYATATATATDKGISNLLMGSSSASMNSSASPFCGSGGTDLIDEFQLQDQLSFLNEGSPTPKIPDLFYPQPDLASSPSGNGDVLFSTYGGAAPNWNSVPHRRSCSVSDTLLGTEEPAGGFGWKPCLYFARGYCKNGNSCRFFHGSLADPVDGAAMVGSPSKLEMMDQCQELLRSKSAHEQRMAAASHLMASTFPYSPAAANKCVNFLLQQQRSDSQRAAVASMMGEDMHKLGRFGAGILNPSSRQIYLTFPADSTFREEDVSNYFSIYGPVQDVRIPYQQKRMFGFVTFLYPETVKFILAKGNPHFVCDARVLVKPYKEKGKVPDKKLQPQEMERGEFLACGSPTGLDSRDPYDLQLGSGMFYNTQDMLWRRKLEEQADLQQAIELQGRRLMGLQLLDVKRYNQRRALTTGAAIPSPTHSSNFFDQCLVLSADHSSQDVIQENGSNPAMATSATAAADQPANVTEKERESSTSNEENGNGKESPHNEESELQDNLEHNLPDNPFASPKAAGDYMTAYSNAAGEAERNAAVSATSSVSNTLITPSLLPAPSTLDMAGVNSCYFQMPRFSSGHGAIGL